MTLSLNSIYNLKAVLKETGIKPDVLRAWERRYGLPMPQRTAGGHRLYSEHDIAIIKWLIARQNDGLSISRAVDMWKENTSLGHDPLAGSMQQASQPSLPVRPVLPSFSAASLTGIDALRADWLSACLDFNETLADQALNQAFVLYPVEVVCTEVLQRGMVDVGSLWYENRASVQQEHFASALALRRLDALLLASPAPTRHQTILVGCPANEWHTFSPLLMALLMRRRGFNVIYLGANVPAAHFAETVESVRASLVVLVAQQLNTAASLQQSAALITERGSLVAFGGRIFGLHPDLVRHVSGYYLGTRMDSAIESIEDLMAVQPVPLRPILNSIEYVDALKAFITQRAFIEASLNVQSSLKTANAEICPDAHRFMGDNIIAALQLGNMTYLDSEIDWLKVLLRAHHLQGSQLCDYLSAYLGAVKQHMPGQALPLTGWLERQIHLCKI